MTKTLASLLGLFFSASMITALPLGPRTHYWPCGTGAVGHNERSSEELFTGTVVAFGGRRMRTSTFSLRITGHTSDEDVRKYLVVLAEEGQERLLDAIKDRDLGSFAIGGHIGRRINAVRETEVDGKRQIRIVFDRWLRMAELWAVTDQSTIRLVTCTPTSFDFQYCISRSKSRFWYWR